MNHLKQWIELGWNRAEYKNAIKIGIASALSMFIADHLSTVIYHPDEQISALWCVLSTIVIMQGYLGRAYRIGLERFSGSCVGVIVSSFITWWLGPEYFSLGIACFITWITCKILTIEEGVYMACMSATIVMVFSSFYPETSPWLFGFYRLFDSLVGILVGLIVLHVLWPVRATTNMQEKISSILFSLSELLRIVGNLKPASVEQKLRIKELIEITLHNLVQDKRFLKDFLLELKTQKQTGDEWIRLQTLCEDMFKAIIAIKGVSKLDLEHAVDDDLIKVTSQTVQLISQTLTTEANNLSQNEPINTLTDLINAYNLLNNELTRFRATKAISKFEFEYVEGFFVFFYHLKSLILQTQKTQQIIREITSK